MPVSGLDVAITPVLGCCLACAIIYAMTRVPGLWEAILDKKGNPTRYLSVVPVALLVAALATVSRGRSREAFLLGSVALCYVPALFLLEGLHRWNGFRAPEPTTRAEDALAWLMMASPFVYGALGVYSVTNALFVPIVMTAATAWVITPAC